MSVGTTAAIVAGSIAAAGAVGGAAINAHAAGSAANTQANAAKSAAQLQADSTQKQLDLQKQQFDQGQANLAPFVAGGNEGLSALQIGMGLQPTGTGPQTQAAGVDPGSLLATYPGGAFTAPTADQAAATPGYQFALNQGMNALKNEQSAQGVFGGASQKEAAQYATGLASNNYQQAYNNALGTYGTNYNTWLQNQQTKLGSLQALAGQGYSAATGTAQLGQQFANTGSGTLQTGAQGQTNALEAAANANSAGSIATGNALSGGINALSTIPTGIAAYNYLNQGAASNPFGSSFFNGNTPSGQSAVQQITNAVGANPANQIYNPGTTYQLPTIPTS